MMDDTKLLDSLLLDSEYEDKCETDKDKDKRLEDYFGKTNSVD